MRSVTGTQCFWDEGVINIKERLNKMINEKKKVSNESDDGKANGIPRINSFG